MAYYATGGYMQGMVYADLNLRIYYRFPRVVLKSHLPSDAHREPSNPCRSGVQPMPYRDTRYSGAGFWTAEVALPAVCQEKSATCEVM